MFEVFVLAVLMQVPCEPGHVLEVNRGRDDKTVVNAELIRQGYGYADRQGSHPRRNEFIALEEGARRQKVGVWVH